MAVKEPRLPPHPRGHRPERREITGFLEEGRRPGLPLPSKPWMPAPFDRADIAAFKALRNGTATPDQQQRGMAWLIEYAARTYGPSYDPASDRDSAFAEGCRHVGMQVVKLLNYRMDVNDEQGR